MKANKQRSKSVISFGTSFISTAPTERIDWVNPLYFCNQLNGKLLNRKNAPRRDQSAGRWENLIRKQVDLKGRASSQRLKENNQSIRVIEPEQGNNYQIRFSKKVYPTVCIDLTNCSGLLHLKQTNEASKLGNFTKKVKVQGGNNYHYRNVTSKQNLLCTQEHQKFSTGQSIENEIKERRKSIKCLIPGKVSQSQIQQLYGNSYQNSPTETKKIIIKKMDNLQIGSLTPKELKLLNNQHSDVSKICRDQAFSSIQNISKIKRVSLNLDQHIAQSRNMNGILNQSLEEKYVRNFHPLGRIKKRKKAQ